MALLTGYILYIEAPAGVTPSRVRCTLSPNTNANLFLWQFDCRFYQR